MYCLQQGFIQKFLSGGVENVCELAINFILFLLSKSCISLISQLLSSWTSFIIVLQKSEAKCVIYQDITLYSYSFAKFYCNCSTFIEADQGLHSHRLFCLLHFKTSIEAIPCKIYFDMVLSLWISMMPEEY